MKRFLEWIGIKQKLHETVVTQPLFKEDEVWWCGLGENIGIEINGKSAVFSRPVVIYKKLGREGCMVIPMSTKLKEGSWYLSMSFQNKQVTFNIAQARVISASRLYSKIGELDAIDSCLLAKAFISLYTR